MNHHQADCTKIPDGKCQGDPVNAGIVRLQHLLHVLIAEEEQQQQGGEQQPAMDGLQSIGKNWEREERRGQIKKMIKKISTKCLPVLSHLVAAIFVENQEEKSHGDDNGNNDDGVEQSAAKALATALVAPIGLKWCIAGGEDDDRGR